MRAMILAAGRGARMGELTAATPKPLLRVADHYLIEYVIANLKRAGITDIVINLSYHGEQIKQALGDGRRYGVNICYSLEPNPPLDVGGGLLQALPLLGDEPFVVVSGDIITDFPIATLPPLMNTLAHLVLVPNPYFNPKGDFALLVNRVHLHAMPPYTYANMGLYHPDLFKDRHPGVFSWKQIMFPAIEAQHVTGEVYLGEWYNVGTPQELAHVNNTLQHHASLLSFL